MNGCCREVGLGSYHHVFIEFEGLELAILFYIHIIFCIGQNGVASWVYTRTIRIAAPSGEAPHISASLS